jgi:hypothetical protein
LPPHARLGFADNFFHAAASAKNKLVAFSDQDDVWLPQKLEVGSLPFEEDRVLLSLHTLTMTDTELRPIGLHRQGISQSKILSPLELDPFATGWGNSMIFRKVLLDVFPSINRPKQPSVNRPLSHDTWIYTLAAALGRVAHIDIPLCLYRQHDSNTMGMGNSPSREKIKGAFTASVGRYIEVESFYASMAKIFDEVSKRQGFQDEAVLAERWYSAKASSCKDRLEVYDARTLAKRAEAFRRLHKSKTAHSQFLDHPNRLSMLKDILVGVMGIGFKDRSQA